MTTPSATRDPSALDPPDELVARLFATPEGRTNPYPIYVIEEGHAAMAHMITWAISRERLRSLVDGDPAIKEWILAEMRRRYPRLG